jgi:hypothetical protein
MEAVVALTDEHDRSEAAASAAFRVYRVELARQVRAGGIDMVMLGPGREAAVNALKAHLDDEISVLDRLHALLRPEERAALVAELRSEGVRLTSAEEPRGASAQRERLERIAAHFGDPVFSAQSALALPGQSPVDAARTRLRDQATRASELVPTLTQGQRNKLGAQIESTLDEEEE